MNRRQHNFIDKENKRPVEPKRRLFLYIIFILVLIGGFYITKAIIGGNLPEDPLAYDPVTLEPKKPEGLLKKISHFIFSKDVTLEGHRKDRINILLLGMGGIGHDGPFLTDTIIIASIKPSTGQIAMLSIPRDLGVKIPGNGWRKINSANAIGEAKKQNWGAAYTTEIIEETFDIDINYYARIDFTAFEEIIDEVGGVNINVERSFVDSQYPALNDEFQVVSFEKGVQNMDGQTALVFARSRHGSNGEGSDFARARRQQKVLLALKEKIFSVSTLANPVRIHNIMKSLDNHVTTNMNFPDILALIKLGRELDTGNIITSVLDTSPNGYLVNGYGENGAFILSPRTGNFDEIKQLIEGIFEIAPAQQNDTPVQETKDEKAEQANVEINNGTWRAGLAARIKERLKEQFTISQIGNTLERPQMTSGIYTVSSSSNAGVIAGALSEELKIPVKQNREDFEYASTTDILVVLGEDFEE